MPSAAFDSRIRAVAATAYDVPGGNRLSLVIDTVDLLYADQAPLFSSVKLSSTTANPSYVSLPVR